MPLAVVAVIILLMKLADIDPVARWSWLWVLAPFGVLLIWWEFVSKWIGWDKKRAESKMKADEKAAQEAKRKARGF